VPLRPPRSARTAGSPLTQGPSSTVRQPAPPLHAGYPHNQAPVPPGRPAEYEVLRGSPADGRPLLEPVDAALKEGCVLTLEPRHNVAPGRLARGELDEGRYCLPFTVRLHLVDKRQGAIRLVPENGAHPAVVQHQHVLIEL
jgi:hypothetical protein